MKLFIFNHSFFLGFHACFLHVHVIKHQLKCMYRKACFNIDRADYVLLKKEALLYIMLTTFMFNGF